MENTTIIMLADKPIRDRYFLAGHQYTVSAELARELVVAHDAEYAGRLGWLHGHTMRMLADIGESLR